MTAKEALEKSYIPYDEIMKMITKQAAAHKRWLEYVLIDEDTIDALKSLGYKLYGPFSMSASFGIEAGSYTIKW